MEKEISCQEVIISNIARRGTGKSALSPIRVVTQVFSKDGNLIAEYDPTPETFAICHMMGYAGWVVRKGKAVNTATVEEWFLEEETEKEYQP
jgi:sugar (pentulose or hexulose) kinase